MFPGITSVDIVLTANRLDFINKIYINFGGDLHQQTVFIMFSFKTLLILKINQWNIALQENELTV